MFDHFVGFALKELRTFFSVLIYDVLRDLVPFVQFKKREKHPWRSVNFSKVAGACKCLGKNTVQKNVKLTITMVIRICLRRDLTKNEQGPQLQAKKLLRF